MALLLAESLEPICFKCKHYKGTLDIKINKQIHICKAYPKGIPDMFIDIIAYNKEGEVEIHKHTKPYPGDNGIQFEPKIIEEKP